MCGAVSRVPDVHPLCDQSPVRAPETQHKVGSEMERDLPKITLLTVAGLRFELKWSVL